MDPSSPKKNFLFKAAADSNVNKLSKSAIIFFKLLHIFLSLDLGFFKHKTFTQKVFFKIVSLCQCLTCCSLYFVHIYFANYNIHLRVWYIVFLVQYIIYISILMISKNKNNFKKFYDELQIIDSKLLIGQPYRFDLKMIIVFPIPVIFKVITYNRECIPKENICIQSIYAGLYSICIAVGVDVITILISFIFYLVYCRLVTYTKVLRVRNVDLNSYLLLYKSLVDLVENTKRTVDPLFVVALLANIPSITMMLVYTLLKIKFGIRQVSPLMMLVDYSSFVHGLVLLLAPPVLGGMMSTQANRLKIELHNLLLEEQDQKNAETLKKLIRYIEARPFKFQVWDFIPLNANLVAIILNFCITYFIVIIQLTHVY